MGHSNTWEIDSITAYGVVQGYSVKIYVIRIGSSESAIRFLAKGESEIKECDRLRYSKRNGA